MPVDPVSLILVFTLFPPLYFPFHSLLSIFPSIPSSLFLLPFPLLLPLFQSRSNLSVEFSYSSSSTCFPSPSLLSPAIISESLQPLSGVCTGMHLFWTQRRGLAGLPCRKWPLCDWFSISRYANNSGVQNHVSSRICSVSVSSSPFLSLIAST